MRVLTIALAILATACTRPFHQPDADPSFVVAIISDLNSAYGSTSYEPEVTTAIALIREWRPDLVLIAGDMIAGQRPTLTDTNVRAMWAAFDSIIAAPLRAARIPFAFTLGNHDASGYPAHARDRNLAAEYWTDPAHMPQLHYIERSRFPRYYAFTHRTVFFVALDASTGELHADSSQLAWLSGILNSAPARTATMRIVLGHVPLYAVAEGRNQRGEVQAQPDSLRVLLEQSGVRLYVSGHHHAYYPGARASLVLLHAGAVGSAPRPLIGSSAAPYKSITLLHIFPARDSIEDRTFRIDGATIEQVDQTLLPPRIDGVNGFVVRRDLSARYR